MACVTENYSNFEVRLVVRFLRAEGVIQSETHCRLVSVYGQNVPSRKEVPLWCNKFKGVQTAQNDPEKHRGKPRTWHTEENCVVVEGLMREDRRIKSVPPGCKNDNSMHLSANARKLYIGIHVEVFTLRSLHQISTVKSHQFVQSE
jgi:hypothetical protein